MATFNVDSLDFSDGEAIRTGADDDFSTRYSSSNDRLEIEDLTNATVGHIPRDTGTDLVGGKFAETLSEGEALADNGEAYDTIQEAVNNASSFVRVGPGQFRESVTIDTAGLTLEGSGERTVIQSGSDISFEIFASDVTVSNLSITESFIGVNAAALRSTINNVKISNTGNVCVKVNESDVTIVNCEMNNAGTRGVEAFAGNLRLKVINNIISDANEDAVTFDDDSIAAGNIDKRCGEGITGFNSNDSIIIANRISNVDGRGIELDGNCDDFIVANNRISNSGESNIVDSGTGTFLDANLTT
jgi:hypothetical protein